MSVTEFNKWKLNKVESWLLKRLVKKQYGVTQIFYNTIIERYYVREACKNLGIDYDPYRTDAFSKEFLEEYDKMGVTAHPLRLECPVTFYREGVHRKR